MPTLKMVVRKNGRWSANALYFIGHIYRTVKQQEKMVIEEVGNFCSVKSNLKEKAEEVIMLLGESFQVNKKCRNGQNYERYN